MPYFLRIDHDGIAQIGGEYDAAPSDDWKPGIVANYLQRWDGSAWQDTAQAEALRVAQAADAIAIPAAQAAREKADADIFVTANNPTARANRAMARVTMQSVQRVIDKVNEVVAFCNSKGASITPLAKSTWPQLLAATKAMNAAETNAVQ